MELENVWQALKSWFFDHGWRILLIMLLASVIRRFGMMFLSRIIDHSIETSERFEHKRDRKLRADTLISLIGSILKIASWIIISLLILSELNVLKIVAPLLAGAGVLSLLLGFGIQTFVKDFISGIFIVAENQYRVGDVVTVTNTVGGDVTGTVIRITLRTTVLRDDDGSIIFIPNGNIARASNQTLDYAKVNIEVTLPHGADFDKAEKAINDLGLKMHHEDMWHHTIIQAPYYHGVQTLDKENVTVEVRAKTIPAEQWRVSSELQERLAKLVSEEDYFDRKKKKS
jgi:moderate conductance mechanosensitive channel